MKLNSSLVNFIKNNRIKTTYYYIKQIKTILSYLLYTDITKINIKIDINKIFLYNNYTFFYKNIKIIIHESISTLSLKNTNYFYYFSNHDCNIIKDTNNNKNIIISYDGPLQQKTIKKPYLDIIYELMYDNSYTYTYVYYNYNNTKQISKCYKYYNYKIYNIHIFFKNSYNYIKSYISYSYRLKYKNYFIYKYKIPKRTCSSYEYLYSVSNHFYTINFKNNLIFIN